MLKIIVVDDVAEARNKLLDRLQQLLELNSGDLDLLPRIDLKPLSRQELKFHEPPDICIVGAGIVSSNLTDIGAIRRTFPESALLASLSAETSCFSILEQLARLGIDDTMFPDISAGDFLRKVVLLSRKAKRCKPGKLVVVDSGKGGLGVTTLSAALADALVTQGKRVALIDLDFETQDLSRFLQARPFINENLQLLFDRQRPVTQEFVEQAMTRVWQHGKGQLLCISPIEESEDLYSGAASYSRTLISILEVLDSSVDCVIADVGSARGALLRTLYRVADKVLFVMSNDPAALYASTDKLAHLRGLISTDSEIVLTLNNASAHGLAHSTLIEEFSRILNFSSASWSGPLIPYCAGGRRWPGSGSSLYSQAKPAVRSALLAALVRLEVAPPLTSATRISQSLTVSLVKRLMRRLFDLRKTACEDSRFTSRVRAAGAEHLTLPSPARLIAAPSNTLAKAPFNSSDELDLESLILPAVTT